MQGVWGSLPALAKATQGRKVTVPPRNPWAAGLDGLGSPRIRWGTQESCSTAKPRARLGGAAGGALTPLPSVSGSGAGRWTSCRSLLSSLIFWRGIDFEATPGCVLRLLPAVLEGSSAGLEMVLGPVCPGPAPGPLSCSPA